MKTEQATRGGRDGAVAHGLTYLAGRELRLLKVMSGASGPALVRLRAELERIQGLKARLKG